MKKVLVLIDVQNDFIDGALGSKEAMNVLEKIKEKVITYPKEQIYATRDTHGQDYLFTLEGQKLPVIHCQKETKGWHIHQALSDYLLKEHIFDKTTFGSIELAQKMKKLAQEEEQEIELVGICTDICVISNALLLKTYLPNTNIRIDASCCVATTPENHQKALEVMKSCHIEIIE